MRIASYNGSALGRLPGWGGAGPGWGGQASGKPPLPHGHCLPHGPPRSHQARPVTVHSQQAASRQACPAAAGPAHRRAGQGPITARPRPREGEPQGPYPVLGGGGPPRPREGEKKGLPRIVGTIRGRPSG